MPEFLANVFIQSKKDFANIRLKLDLFLFQIQNFISEIRYSYDSLFFKDGQLIIRITKFGPVYFMVVFAKPGGKRKLSV